jgi:ribose transport system substrate-binding protein
MPIIIGDNTSEFINWWLGQKGYDTLSQGSSPGCGAAAFWATLNVLNGYKVPEAMMLGVPHVTLENIAQYGGMGPGSYVSPNFTNQYVVDEIIKPALK